MMLMVSPQADPAAVVRPGLVRARDDRYGFSTEELRAGRADVEAPAEEHPGQADYWLRHLKGFAVDVVPHERRGTRLRWRGCLLMIASCVPSVPDIQ